MTRALPERLPYYIVNAFTSRTFRGNPAGVCPLDEWLPNPVLQAIAAENNLAETAFFVIRGESFRLRWFSPTQEVPLCGHATIAAALAIFTYLRPGLDRVDFATLGGRLTVRRKEEWLELDLPRLTPVAVERPPEALREGLGTEIETVLRVDADPNYYAIVAGEEAVRAASPRLERLARLHPHGVAITAPGKEADFVSRYFAPSYGIPEDPVTGSIQAALAPYWAERLERPALRAFQLSPRGGELRCRVGLERVVVAGQAVVYLEGSIRVPEADGTSP